MKQDIHPTYHKDATITCACGNEVTVGSTREESEVEICSECHPFYTGVEKTVDTAGRIDKFRARQEKAQKQAESKEKKDDSADESDKEDDKQEGQASGSGFEDVKKQMEEADGDEN